jgi:sporulation protein YlmC with PRC-barrel domain
MQYSINNFVGYTINAKDGRIGKVNAFYFDDLSWTILYFVVETELMLPEREIFIPIAALDTIDWNSRIFHVNLAIKQIKNSLYFGTGKMLSAKAEKKKQNIIQQLQNDSHLCCTNKIKGYRIFASDGEIGYLEDYIVDDDKWDLSFLIVETLNCLPGRKVLILSRWINRIERDELKVYLNLSQESVKNIPEFDPSQPIVKNYEKELFIITEKYRPLLSTLLSV